MDLILQDLEAALRFDLVAAAAIGATVAIFWRRLLPVLALLAMGVTAWRWGLQSHLANASPVVIAVGVIVLGLATLQALVVLLFGNHAANGAVGYLVANMVASIVKAPFLLLFAIAKRAFRHRPRMRGPSSS